MLSLNATQLAAIAQSNKTVKWLFTITDNGSTEYKYATGAISGVTNDIVLTDFSGITLSRNLSENMIIAPSDVSFKISNSGNTLDFTDFKGGSVLIDLYIVYSSADVKIASWLFRIKKAEPGYQNLSIVAEDFLQTYIKGDYPNNRAPEDIFPSNRTYSNEKLCIPVPFGTAYIPLRDVFITDAGYLILGPTGVTYTITKVRSPRDEGLKSEYASTDYTFAQSTKADVDANDWRVFQAIIADSDNDGAVDAHGCWMTTGGPTKDVPVEFTRSDTATMTNPADVIDFVLQDMGVPSANIDATTFTSAGAVYDGWGLEFNGAFWKTELREIVLAKLLIMCHSCLQVGEKVELHVLSKTSQKTITDAEVLRYVEQGEGSFSYQDIMNTDLSDGGYISYQPDGEAQDEFNKVLVGIDGAATVISSVTFECPFVQDSQDVKRIGILHFQRLFGMDATISFLAKGTCLALQPDDIITINEANYGGSYAVLIDSMKINKDLSIDFHCSKFKADFDDWGDLTPDAISPGSDTINGNMNPDNRTPLSADLVASYSFSDKSPNYATDLSSYGNDLYSVDGTLTHENWFSGKALNVADSSGISGPVTNFPSTGMALSLWMKFTSGFGLDILIFEATLLGTPGDWEFYINTSGYPRFKINKAVGSDILEYDTDIGDDEKHHIFINYDGSYIDIYIDNELKNTIASTQALATEGGFHIGDILNGGSFLIDEVRIYNGPLTQAERNGLYLYPGTNKVPIPSLTEQTKYFLSDPDFEDLADAATTLNALGIDCVLVIDDDATMDENVSFNNEVILSATPGNTISLGSYDLTLNSQPEAGMFQWIDASSSGVLTLNNCAYAYAEWTGAKAVSAYNASLDYRAEIQALCDSGANEIRLWDSGYYMVTGVTTGTRTGIKVNNNQKISLGGPSTIIHVVETSDDSYAGIYVTEVSNVFIEGNGGTIEGETDVGTHSGAHQGGHCLMIEASENVTVKDLRCIRGMGDGIVVAYEGTGSYPHCKNIKIENCDCGGEPGLTTYQNRRNAMSISGVYDMEVIGGRYNNSPSTILGCGIDVEPNADRGDGNPSIVNGLLIDGIEATNNYADGISVVGYGEINDAKIVNCNLYSNTASGTSRGIAVIGVSAINCRRIIISNNKIYDNDYGMVINNASQINISNNIIYANTVGGGIWIGTAGMAGLQQFNISDNIIKSDIFGIYILGTSSYQINGLTISGNTIKNCSHGISCGYIAEASIIGNTIGTSADRGIYITYSDIVSLIGNVSIDNVAFGIKCIGVENSTVSKNDCYYNGEEGIYMSSGNNNIISENRCRANSQTTDNTYSNIRIQSDDYDHVINNMCRQGGGAKKPDYGIKIDSSTFNTYLSGNNLYDSGKTDEINNSGTLSFTQGNYIFETVTAGSPTLKGFGVTYLNSNGGAITGTLPSGQIVGERKTVKMIEASNSSTVALTHDVYSYYTFAALNDYLLVEWTGALWTTIAASGCAGT